MGSPTKVAEAAPAALAAAFLAVHLNLVII